MHEWMNISQQVLLCCIQPQTSERARPEHILETQYHYLQIRFSTRVQLHESHSNMMLVAIGMATCMRSMDMVLSHAQVHAHAAEIVPAESHRAPPSDLPHFLPSEEVSNGKVRPKHWGGSRPSSLPNRRIRSVPAVMLPH